MYTPPLTPDEIARFAKTADERHAAIVARIKADTQVQDLIRQYPDAPTRGA